MPGPLPTAGGAYGERKNKRPDDPQAERDTREPAATDTNASRGSIPVEDLNAANDK